MHSFVLPSAHRNRCASQARPRFLALFAFGLLLALATAEAQPIFRERHLRPGAGALHAFAANDATLVVVGDNGRILTSPDGVAWTPRDSGTNASLRGIAVSDTQFVAVGDGGTVLRSDDGMAWTTVRIAESAAQLHAIAHGGGRYVAVGSSGAILHSPDGYDWAPTEPGVTSSLRSIGWNVSQQRFIAVGDEGALLTSPDGIAWTKHETGTTGTITAVETTGGFTLLETGRVREGGLTGTPVATAVVFSPASHPLAGRPRSLAVSRTAGQFRLVVGDDGFAAGGSQFRHYETGTTKHLFAAGFARGTFFAVGEAEIILQGVPVEYLAHRIHNLSTRSLTGGGSAALITGFVISGTGTKRLLVRGAGPSLAAFGVGQPLSQPVLTVYDAAGNVVAHNAGWSHADNAAEVRETAALVGAYPYAENSADSALLLTLAPGAYTAQVSGPGQGVGLVELYDPEAWPVVATSRLVNLSSRCLIASGEATAITGMSLPQGRRLLIRAVGPTLTQFGVEGALADPQIELVRPAYYTHLIGGGVLTPAAVVASNDDWSTTVQQKASGYGPQSVSADDIRAASVECAAFPLPEGSKDAVLLVTNVWSSMTVQVSGSDGGSGIALVEVYDLGPSQ